MTGKEADTTATMRCPAPLILYGIDSRGKAKAARFRKEHAGLANQGRDPVAAQCARQQGP
jgi:hypothetical protein